MLSNRAKFLDEQQKVFKTIMSTLKSINEVNPKAAIELHKHQLDIGKSLYMMNQIIKRYHPEALEEPKTGNFIDSNFGKIALTRTWHGRATRS